MKNGNFMVPHEMEVIMSLSKWCKAEAQVSAQVSFEACKKHLRTTLRGFTEDPDFIHVFRLVVDLGGDTMPFLQDLGAFTSRFVDPSARRLRFDCFDIVADLPLQNPLLKIGILKWAYTHVKSACGSSAMGPHPRLRVWTPSSTHSFWAT